VVKKQRITFFGLVFARVEDLVNCLGLKFLNSRDLLFISVLLNIDIDGFLGQNVCQ
jgi:hypothetical protein